MSTTGPHDSQAELEEIYKIIDEILASPNYGKSSLDKYKFYLPGYNQRERQRKMAEGNIVIVKPASSRTNEPTVEPDLPAAAGQKKKGKGCCTIF